MKGAGMFFVYDMLIGNPDCVPALEENTKKYNSKKKNKGKSIKRRNYKFNKK